jgi:hypothetical protein
VTAVEFEGAIPFDLWDIVPASLAAVLPNVMWSRDRLHRLALPVVELPVAELRWQLDLPWWRAGDRRFAVSPNQVRREPQLHAQQWRRTLDADLRFPIHLLQRVPRDPRDQRDPRVILDGVHRLLKADALGLLHVSAHVVSHATFTDQVVERARSGPAQGR